MLPQQTKTLLVLVVAIYLGYLYISGESDTTNSPKGDVSLDQLDKIQYTQNMEGKLKAFVLGATGAVGKEIVKALAADARFAKVTLIGRRPVPLDPAVTPGHAKMENQIIDFEKLDEHKEVFKGYDVGFSSLGTTRQTTGAAGFYRVDHDYVVQTAKLAKEGGCNHLHLVSSGGANKNSYYSYLKTKGEVEEELSEMNFPRLSVYRPGVLLVEKAREESRIAESVLRGILKPLDRMRWFSIDVPVLGKVIVANCFREASASTNTEILENKVLIKFGKELANGNVPPPSTGDESKTDSAPFS